MKAPNFIASAMCFQHMAIPGTRLSYDKQEHRYVLPESVESGMIHSPPPWLLLLLFRRLVFGDLIAVCVAP